MIAEPLGMNLPCQGRAWESQEDNLKRSETHLLARKHAPRPLDIVVGA